MTGPGDQASVSPLPKEDPEALVLRGRPRRVVRFRRGLLAGAAGGLCAAVAGLTWVALEPHGLGPAVQDDSGKPFARPQADVLAGAPARYSEVPKLGPPLPGDLGRPILEQQRSTAAAAEEAGAEPSLAAQSAAAERQRRLAEEQAARSSALLAQLSGKAPSAAAPAAPPPAAEEPPAADASAGPQQHKIDFVRPGAAGLSQHAVSPPASGWMLSAGTIIPASLVTGLNSDLPGLVLAQVTENVRDSATGRTVLIPQGARLIGRYDSAVAYGQKRALLVWERIIFPNGASLDLGKMPATDAAGYSGLGGRVNSHPWQLVKGVLLSTLLGLGSELSFGGSDIARAISQSSQQNGARAGEQLVGRALDVQPTLILEPGWPVRVIVDRDLVLEPWKG